MTSRLAAYSLTSVESRRNELRRRRQWVNRAQWAVFMIVPAVLALIGVIFGMWWGAR